MTYASNSHTPGKIHHSGSEDCFSSVAVLAQIAFVQTHPVRSSATSLSPTMGRGGTGKRPNAGRPATQAKANSDALVSNSPPGVSHLPVALAKAKASSHIPPAVNSTLKVVQEINQSFFTELGKARTTILQHDLLSDLGGADSLPHMEHAEQSSADFQTGYPLDNARAKRELESQGKTTASVNLFKLPWFSQSHQAPVNEKKIKDLRGLVKIDTSIPFQIILGVKSTEDVTIHLTFHA